MYNKQNRGKERCIYTTTPWSSSGQCAEYQYCRGLCFKHYTRVRRLVLTEEYSWKQLENSGKVLNKQSGKQRSKRIEEETRDYLEGRC